MHTPIILSVLVLILCSCNPIKKREELASQPAATKLIDSLKIQQDDLSLFVDKSCYLLCLMNGKDTLKKYDAVFGGNQIDDKRMEGDQCTPEGIFKIRDLYPHGKWTKFIWIDYPNDDSWKKFNAAMSKGEIPEDAKIGGEIGIHGVPIGGDRLVEDKVNWTLGCISLGTEEINDVYSVSFVGMKIKIQK